MYAYILLIFCTVVIAVLLAVYLWQRTSFLKQKSDLERKISSLSEELVAEKTRSQELLANVIPRNIGVDIIEQGRSVKTKYNFVTVLFSDIQGFTRIAEEMNPESLIDELDKFFFHFDSVVEKYRIEKIKTIGDAYMCAGGIPEKNRTNPVEVILAALEMQAYMNRLKLSSDLEGMKYWDIRIGIHTGTVVAGIIGLKKRSYDIWGDTVNTASRMESSGEGGKINISGTTYEFVKDFFECEYRGRMPVKYKGELEMYFVKGILPGLCDETGNPNDKFIIRMQMIKLQDLEDVVIKMFEDEAPPNLYFHNSSLVKNIITQVDLLSRAESVQEKELVILKLAALFLFTGYIRDYDKPFEASEGTVRATLPGYGFGNADIEAVTGIIRNSYLENYETLSDDILHDARYDYLGRVDYMKLTGRLIRELSENGRSEDRERWNLDQQELLRKHQFRTPTARLLRSVQVEEQLLLLESGSE